MEVDKVKVRTIDKLPLLTLVKVVRSFIGHTGL